MVSAEQATFDYAMIPTCGRLDQNSLGQDCLPEKTILATISDMDANGNITSTDPIEVAPSSPETPGVAVLGTGKLYGINGYGGALAGTTSLPCVVVPQKDPSSCGQVFIENGFQNAAKESEYRNLAGILANPAMSTTSSSTNLQVQFPSTAVACALPSRCLLKNDFKIDLTFESTNEFKSKHGIYTFLEYKIQNNNELRSGSGR